MRVNVYSQELTSDVEMVSKIGKNEQGQTETFYGIRLYLQSAEQLHNVEGDDDRSAVTLWLPKSYNRKMALVYALSRMARLVEERAVNSHG